MGLRKGDTRDNLKILQQKAKALIDLKLPQKEVAERLRLSYTTISVWVRKFEWKKVIKPDTKAIAEKKELHESARVLLEDARLSLSQVSKIIKVSEVTLRKWIKRFQWFKDDPKLIEKYVAMVHVVMHGYSQKETSLKLSISEKTLRQWAKKYDWKKQRLSFKRGEYHPLTAFKKFVEFVAPQRAKAICSLVDEYMLKEQQPPNT